VQQGRFSAHGPSDCRLIQKFGWQDKKDAARPQRIPNCHPRWR